MDVAAVAQEATGSVADVAWYENDGSGLNWTKHPITTDLLKARWVHLEDIDKNGFMDAIVSDNIGNEIIVFFNNDGGQNWTENIIDNTFKSPNPVFAFDIDLDNEFEILPTSTVNNALIWYDYHLGAAYAESLEIYPFSSTQSLSDTLRIRTHLNNQENHSASAFVFYQGEQFSFIDSLEFLPNYHVEKLDPDLVETGRKLFYDENVGCAQCHPPPFYTDFRTHDVGTGSGANEVLGVLFDTPTLLSLSRSAPYLHDGSAATLLDVLTLANPNDKHGITSQLSSEGLEALIEYMLSFDHGN